MLRGAKNRLRRLVYVDPSAENKYLHLEGFSKFWVEELEGGRCLVWALEGARGCTVSLGWGLGEGEGCFWPLDPQAGKLEGQLCDQRGTRFLLDQPSFP